MANKKAMAEQIQRILAGGDVGSDFPLHLLEIYQLLDFAVAKAIRQDLEDEKNRARPERIVGGWTKRYTGVEVKYDEVSGQSYSDLPAEVMIFPRDLGVWMVGSNDQRDKYERTTIDYIDKFAGLYALTMSRQVKFWVVDQQVWFSPKLARNCQVSMWLVPKPSELADDDELPIPAGREPEVLALALEFGKQQLGNPHDEIIDNNKKP